MFTRLMSLALLVAIPLASGSHSGTCIVTSANPDTVNTLTTPDARTFYVEERRETLSTLPPVPFSGYLIGEGTSMYEEANGVEGLQRGGLCSGYMPGPGRAANSCVVATCFPSTPEVGPIDVNCAVIAEDPIQDETCGHGPDASLL